MSNLSAALRDISLTKLALPIWKPRHTLALPDKTRWDDATGEHAGIQRLRSVLPPEDSATLFPNEYGINHV
jgi:hypothetical protein